MRSTKPLKKNGSIEIRLPDQTKAAFMDRCRQEGLTASEAVRSFIDAQLVLGHAARKASPPTWRVAIAGVTGAVLGLGMAAPSLASSIEPTPSAFQKLDRDGDGVLTYQEFRTR